MNLAAVRAHALSSPIDPPQEREFHGGVRRLLKRDAVVVELETADGLVGVAPAGASSSAMREFFEGASQAAFADLLAGEVADAVTGEVAGVADLHDAVAALDLPEPLCSQAVAAIDVAYHDLRGKRAGAPVADLLAEANGAADPDRRLPLYASAGMYMPPEGHAEQAAALRERGFSGYKYRPGTGPESDRRTVELVADAAGEMDVMLDAHLWWKLEDAYTEAERDRIVDAAAERGARWLEEPVAPDDRAGYDALRGRGVPLAGGESEATPADLVSLADHVDVLQGDTRHHRGYTGCWRAVERCVGSETEFVPHHFGTLLGLVANAHLVAAGPDCRLLEYPVFEGDPLVDAGAVAGMYPHPLAFEILATDLAVDDGVFHLPEGPGLGVDLDRSALEAYPFREGPWTEFEYR
jgi:L-alanine-DL-glutamate epimerase-like enolase superfamily enzyme